MSVERDKLRFSFSERKQIKRICLNENVYVLYDC